MLRNERDPRATW